MTLSQTTLGGEAKRTPFYPTTLLPLLSGFSQSSLFFCRSELVDNYSSFAPPRCICKLLERATAESCSSLGGGAYIFHCKTLLQSFVHSGNTLLSPRVERRGQVAHCSVTRVVQHGMRCNFTRLVLLH